MKIIHLADLHLGKRVNEFPMLEDQEFILRRIINIIDEVKADAVVIAGDVYDKSVPSAEAVQLFDDFLCRLAKRKLHIFVINGNHDSAERIAFGGRIMDEAGVHMAPVYDGNIKPVVLEDKWGKVNFYLLPFLKPVYVKRLYPDDQIGTYTEAVCLAVEKMRANEDERNLLVAHQFVTGGERCESEEISVGGSDNVDMRAFKGFDYVALGHLHRPQHVGQENIRYCGSPLKYSFSEASHNKSATIVTIEEKGSVKIENTPLEPKHDMREIKGAYMELTAKDFYKDTVKDDYMHITLTDEEDIPDVINKLRVIYPNLMRLDYDNARTRTSSEVEGAEDVDRQSPFELLCQFYEKQNNREMKKEQKDLAKDIMEKIWEDEI
ncbi:MAG: exonuclease SbcCD subunit D [Clostridiales bacterium]|nr:exonuclease SbcCD subunit D [Clostridiales bacterium]